jgi:hypothetical protein
MTPDVLDELAPEEQKPKAVALLDGDIEVNGDIAPANEVSTLEIAS